MKILRGNNLNVDFQHPIEMTEEQRKKFINFLKTLFYTVKEERVKTFRPCRIGEKLFGKEWDVKELALIFKLDEVNEEVCKKLGRTWMSIDMKRGFFIPMILEEARKKKVDIYKIDIKKFIQEFIKEHEEEILRHREEKIKERKELRELQEEMENLKEEIPNLKSMIGIGGITEEIIEEKKGRLKEINEKLREIVGL